MQKNDLLSFCRTFFADDYVQCTIHLSPEAGHC